MLKKLLCVALSVPIFMLCGCSKSRHIDTAAIAENVVVDIEDGRPVYSFFLLSSDEKPWTIDIPANSFEEACELAESKYIPNLSVSKLNMMVVNDKIYSLTMKNDIEYVSSRAAISPIAYVAIGDSNAIKKMKSEKKVPEIIENELELIKSKSKNVKTNFLSMYNSIKKDRSGFEAAYINSEKELKTDIIKIKL